MNKTRKIVSSLLLALVLLSASAVITGKAYALWFDPNWSYRQMITIDESMIPDNGPLSDFPVLIQLTSSDSNPVFGNARADGYDVLFTQADGMTPLSHEIEEYNSVTEDMNMWVRIPTLSDTADTVLYMYYGNPGIASDPSTTSTWNSNFLMVQHLHETSGTHFDSTSSNNDSSTVSVTQQGQTTTSVVDGADEFAFASSDVINVPDDNSLDITGALTIEAWVYPRAAWAGNWEVLVDKNVFWTSGYALKIPDFGGCILGRGILLSLHNMHWFCSNISLDVNTWNHVVAVYDTNVVTFYHNGVLDSSQDASFLTPLTNTLDLGIGGDITPPVFWGSLNGFMDEVRVSNIDRSADWVRTSFNNQNSPSSFLNFGAPAMFTPVPTMTEWGMIIFMILAGLGAIYYLRRQRTV